MDIACLNQVIHPSLRGRPTLRLPVCGLHARISGPNGHPFYVQYLSFDGKGTTHFEGQSCPIFIPGTQIILYTKCHPNQFRTNEAYSLSAKKNL